MAAMIEGSALRSSKYFAQLLSGAIPSKIVLNVNIASDALTMLSASVTKNLTTSELITSLLSCWKLALSWLVRPSMESRYTAFSLSAVPAELRDSVNAFSAVDQLLSRAAT